MWRNRIVKEARDAPRISPHLQKFSSGVSRYQIAENIYSEKRERQTD